MAIQDRGSRWRACLRASPLEGAVRNRPGDQRRVFTVSLRKRRACKFLQISRQIFANFPLVSANFSKDSFGGFVEFQRLTGSKKLFSANPNFFGDPDGCSLFGCSKSEPGIVDNGRSLERRGGGKPEIIVAELQVFSK